MNGLRTLAVSLLLVGMGIAGRAEAGSGDAEVLWVPAEAATWSLGESGEVPDVPWWSDFGDDALSTIVERGLAANHDLAAARERVAMADAAAALALGGVLPTLTFTVSESTSPFDSLGFQFGGFGMQPGTDTPELFHSGSAMFGLSVPVDVFGKNVLGYQAGRMDAAASRGDRDGARIALAARIAGAYLDLVGSREQIGVATRQIETSEALLLLVEDQYRRGSAGALDVLQQRQQVAAMRALLPQGRLGERIAESQIRALLALGEEEPLPPTASDLPDLPPLPPVGVPADLLVDRPDLRAAAARVEAAEHRRVASVRALLPTLALSGQAGWQARHAGELTTQDTWSAGASLSVPLFQGGRGRASVRQARAGAAVAAHTLAQATLQAVQDVETALHAEAERAEALAAARQQLEAAHLAWAESLAQYEEGLVPYLSALIALNTLHASELSELQSRRALLGARIQLLGALGGAWTEEDR